MRDTDDILAQIGHTPLVPLRKVGSELAVPILVKCEHMNPGGSIKDRIAQAIVAAAEESGALRPGMTLIEATAGNTGMGLALVAAVRGYELVCVMPEKMSEDKRHALRALGAKVIITPNLSSDSPENFRNVAERMAEEKGFFLCDQFRNPANVEIHRRTTGVEIFEQTKGNIGAFVAGVGTGGTITGVAKCLKERLDKVEIVLADPIGSDLASWLETGQAGEGGEYAVEGLGGSQPAQILDFDFIDSSERISDEESFSMARRLIREEGLFVGGSAGTNVAAALRIAERGEIEGSVVTVLPDSWDRYLSKPWLRGD